MPNPKVFEFAKEIGMTPLALMEKIREWQIPVKSHMAELDPETLEQIKIKLSPPRGSSAKSTTKKASLTTATKAPRKASAAGKASDEKPPAMKKSTAIKAKPGGGARVETPPPPAAPVAAAASAVVRRKKAEPIPATAKEDPDHLDDPSLAALETEQIPVTPASAAGTAQPTSPAAVAALIEEPETPEITLERATSASPGSSPEQNVAAVEAVESFPIVSEPTRPTPGRVESPVSAAPASSVETPKPVIAAPPISEPAKVATPAPPARKKEVTIGMSGVASATAPRRNIIGRMDLSRVQPPPGSGTGFNSGGGSRPPFGQRPQGGGGMNSGGGGMSGGMNAQNRGRSHVRAGFVQAAPPPVFPTESFDPTRKRLTPGGMADHKRARPGEAPGATAGAKEADALPPAFDAAEFRKREMVFQPKKRKGLIGRAALQTNITTAAAHKRVVEVYGSMKMSDLAQAIGVKAPLLMKALIKNGVTANMNSDLDYDTIALIVPEFKWEAQSVKKTDVETVESFAYGDLTAEKILRPPVVAVMGHVDHGKTSLLDAIRKTDVVSGEAGGITQHIGAYQVTLADGHKITFLDTPGHEAFTAMRARGANITDISVIVVAADDGVMPQTSEAINHSKAAGVPIVIAINKVDKPGANIDRIKQQLTEFEIVPEEWGGQNIFCEVSALQKKGINELLEQLKLLAEIGELKANPKRSAKGTVIEAKLDRGRGVVATLLVQDGTLKVGDEIVAGTVVGRVRSLLDDRGARIKEALPGTPVEILGLDTVPGAGDPFDAVKDDDSAAEVVRLRRETADAAGKRTGKISLEEIFAKVKQGDVKEFSVVLKADVSGSLEAIEGMFTKLSTPEVKLKLVHRAVGGITESDVLLASTAKGVIIGFNVRPDSGASAQAKRMGVDIRTYSIVYELVDDMKKAMTGLLAPTIVEKVLGRAEVRNVFTIPKAGTIAGSFVSDGKIQRSNMARLIRDGKIIYEGKLASLKRFKDDAKEVATGFECGIAIENFNDIKVGDAIEAFIKEEVSRSLAGSAAPT